MDDYNSLPFKFEDCDSFLTSLENGDISSDQPPLFDHTPSPQEFLARSYELETEGDWSVDKLLDLDSGLNSSMDPSFVNTSQVQQQLLSQQQQQQFARSHSDPNPLLDSSTVSPLSSSSPSTIASNNLDSEPGFNYNSLNPSTIFQSQPDRPEYPITPPYPSNSRNSMNVMYDAPHTDDDDSSYSESYGDNHVFKEESVSPFEIKEEESNYRSSASSRKSSKAVSPNGGADTKGHKIAKPRKEKTSHNMIEKRYRTNINDKIVALRDCVPSLRCVVTGPTRPEDLEGLTPASKLNKATVLTKAAEYIMHLQKRNAMLAKENNELRKVNSNDYNMPNMNTGQNQLPSKMLMASMAGLIGTGLLADDGDLRGLSMIPGLNFLPNMPTLSQFSQYDASTLLIGFKVALIFGAILYIFVPSIFATKPSKVLSNVAEEDNQSSTSGAHHDFSVRELRQQSWLTNSRSLSVPQSENRLDSALRLAQASAQIVAVGLLGVDGYKVLGRLFDSNSFNKHISWFRAIDMQLSGGDVACSPSRLLYTFLKSFSLPSSSGRSMIQAVQAHVLLYHYKSYQSFANSLWTSAGKRINKQSDDSKLELPSHLIKLVNCDDVFVPETIQRLYNLVFNLPSESPDEGYQRISEDKGLKSCLDIVAALHANRLLHEVVLGSVEDGDLDFRKLELAASIAPPHSVVRRRVAATEALLLGPKDPSFVENAIQIIRDEVAWAPHKKSTSSSSDGSETTSVQAPEILDELSDFSNSDADSVSTEREATFMSSAVASSPGTQLIAQDSRLAVRCSLIITYLAMNETSHAFKLLQGLEINQLEDIGLLGFVSLWRMLSEIKDRKYTNARRKLEDLTAVARVWVGSEAGECEGLSLNCRREIVGECVQMSIHFGGFDDDEGYGTQ